MFGGAKPWAERRVAEKPCRRCTSVFQPKTGGHLYCEACGPVQARETHAKGQRRWRAKDPAKAATNKANHDLKRFGLTLDMYTDMLERQGGVCVICGTAEPKGRGKLRVFAVDHCHRTNRVRALLCHRCNGALGMVGDDPEVLATMIDYLKEHSENANE